MALLPQRLHLPMASDEAEFARTVESAHNGRWAADDVAALARHLASSGTQIDWPPGAAVADLASTGGPGSLSTLLAPLWLCASGLRVAKLTVPGRPAGSIDTLGTLPGYRVNLATKEVRAAMAACGFAHFQGAGQFAPMDAALFQYRKMTGNLSIPPLAVASILSKKVAVGITAVGLDVRVGPHGNFGATIADCRANSRLFCETASQLGISAVAFLTPDRGPPQPWIGRGESLVAMAQALRLREVKDSNAWLDQHVRICHEMANNLADTEAMKRADPAEAFESHLEAQGSGLAAFLRRVDEVMTAERLPIPAADSGVLSVDLATLRQALVSAQADPAQGPYQDPAGVQLLVRPGERVRKGETVALVRGGHREGLMRATSLAFHVTDTVSAISNPPGGMEVVRG